MRKGFSRTTGVRSTVVYGGLGKLVPGTPWLPTKTMFQLEPVQEPSWELRVSHCCWVPDLTWPSILVSAMKPPLDQPPSLSSRLPRTCIRRYEEACDTAQRSVPPVGVTERFSAPRQKFWVAFCGGNQSASTCTAPLIVTASGDCPRPRTWV